MSVRTTNGLLVWLAMLLPSVAMAASTSDLSLMDAIRKGDQAAVVSLLQKNPDVNQTQADGTTPLAWAVDRNNIEAVKLLLSKGANVNAANQYGATPLYVACTNGNAAMAELLLQSGANQDSALLSGETALMTAVNSGSLDVVRTLLSHGAKPNAQESRGGQNALMWAVAQRHPEMVRDLIAHQADVKLRSKNGFSALMFAAQQGELDSEKMLLEAGADPNSEVVPKDKMTPLLIAIANGNPEAAELLIEKGANPDSAEQRGFTPLHYAAMDTDMGGVAKSLLAHGANANARLTKDVFRGNEGGISIQGATPLFLAASNTNPEVAKVLLDGGADLKITTKDKTTALGVAAGVGYPQGREWTDDEKKRGLEVTKMLVEHGADLNAIGEHGWTALHGAAYKGNDEIMDYLLSKGAKPDFIDEFGQTPLSIATAIITEGLGDHYYQSPRIYRKTFVELLLKHGAKTIADSGVKQVGVFDEAK